MCQCWTRTKIPYLLHKRRRAEVEREMLDTVAENSTFIKRIITGAEEWTYEYDNKKSRMTLQNRAVTEKSEIS